MVAQAHLAAQLARVRAETTLTMPDCIDLPTAELDREAVATFDDRLARTAQQRGIETLPRGDFNSSDIAAGSDIAG